jgi:hypothetical protein
MRSRRSLTLSFVLLMWGTLGLAQSPQSFASRSLPGLFNTQPLPGRRIPPLDFRALAPSATNSVRPLNLTKMKQLNPFVLRPNIPVAPQNALTTAKIQMATNDERCYAIRGYEFNRVAPDSDATRLNESSTCEPASQVHLKGAITR